MTVARIARAGAHERLSALEMRADGHDKVIKPMADQVAEMYALLTRLRNINWFLVKVAAYAGGAMGFVSVVLMAVTSVVRLWTGH